MNETIVVATDESPAAQAAIDWAATLAGRAADRLVIIHAIEAPIEAYTAYGVDTGAYRLDVGALLAAGRRLLDIAVSRVRADHPTLDVVGVVERGQTGQLLVEHSRDARLLVVGAHQHHGLVADAMLGSNARYVLHHATTTVAVIPAPAVTDNDSNAMRITVGVDRSPAAARALEWAAAEAVRWDADLDVVHCWDYPYIALGAAAVETQERIRLDAALELDILIDALSVSRPDLNDIRLERHLANGSPSAVLLDAAAHSDMLVVGTRGRGGFRSLLLGSVVQHLTQHSSCPVVVVRA